MVRSECREKEFDGADYDEYLEKIARKQRDQKIRMLRAYKWSEQLAVEL